MNRLLFFSIALAAAVPALAQEQAPPGASEQPSGDLAAPKLKTLLQDCDAHRFETSVQSVVDGKPHMSRVKMCGVEGQSDAEWIGTLKDAVAKLEANTEMAASTRDQIITAVKAEIARLEGETSKPAAAPELPAARPVESSNALTSDYSILPPLPNNPPPRAHVRPPAQEAAEVAAPPANVVQTDEAKPVETAVAPPIETAVAPPVETALAPPVVQAPPAKPVAKPRLTLSCISPEFPAGGECVTLSRDTVLRVRAGEDLAAGLSLRFLRNGAERGTIELGSLRSGQSINYRLPSQICSGVVSAEVQLDIVRNGQRVDRRGPYLLHC
jgi:hypothetical protein